MQVQSRLYGFSYINELKYFQPGRHRMLAKLAKGFCWVDIKITSKHLLYLLKLNLERGISKGMSNHTFIENSPTPQNQNHLQVIKPIVVTYHVVIHYYHIRQSLSLRKVYHPQTSFRPLNSFLGP